jgi:hypothetical protein
MSGNLDIRFANDMPTSAVEVVSPDLTTVSRVMLSAGRSKTVAVPSELSFLRVHLPTGRIVTLTADRGTLSRTISRAMIEAAELPQSSAAQGPTAIPEAEPSLAEVGSYHEKRAASRGTPFAAATPSLAEVTIAGLDTVARVHGPRGEVMSGNLSADGREAAWDLYDTPWAPPYRLQIEHPWGALESLLPANCRSMYVRVDRVREESALAVSVRLASRDPVADTILNYVSRGDLYSAEAMLEWADEAEQLLEGKMQDPYAAAIGAYLLLKLRHFDRLHMWTRNLADWFQFLPDGCVICASQLIQQDPTQEGEIRKYLLEATARGLPVYTGGLRLLMDGLRLLDDDVESRAQLEILTSKASTVKWDAPVTTGYRPKTGASPIPVIYSIEFMSSS